MRRFLLSLSLVTFLALQATAAAEDHWAYRKPIRPPLPEVKDGKWPRNGLDYFILAKLEREGLRPAPEADRATLIRRVSLDLTGLPPTPKEVEEFIKDTRPGAYERVVDRLLASPHYGERWTRPWLDLARYADTNGYEKDRPRTMWRWRDWVIHAFNDDMPFDQFTIEQIAGDLLPGATPWQKAATGFHRNSMLNDEGGINPEEFRVVAVKDRVDTTATVWLGTTLECAQCHSHKYDPFTQTEYYQFLAFFNQTADNGVGNGPEIAVPTPAEQKELEEIYAKKLAELQKSLKEAETRVGKAQTAWEEKLAAAPRPPIKLSGLYLHYPLQAGKGMEVADASANQRNGTLKNVKEANYLVGALRLDGKGGHVDGGNVADFERTDRFSYGCWLKPESNTGGIIARIDDPNAYRGFDLFLNEGKIEVHIVNHWPTDALKVATKDAFRAGEWRHVQATYDGSSKAAGVKIYVDGKEVALSVANDTLKSTIRTSVPLHVGRRHVMGAYHGQICDVRIYDRTLGPAEVAVLADRHPALEILSIPRDQRDPLQKLELTSYYRTLDPELTAIRAKIAVWEVLGASIQPPTSMVMQELPKPRENYLMIRGDYKQKGKSVEPGVPAVLHPMPKEAPANRLGLARWLVDRENPLTARVTVNRFWQAYFGRGLVQTPEDFGSQGDPPTHPDLLDWLAVEFMEPAARDGNKPKPWSMKAFHRLIVTSATYRQASAASRELVQRDPYNLLHARGSRLRLEYEMLRDQALAAGGLLSRKIGGPSVMPPQPPGIWENSFGFYDLPNFRWKEATDEDRYRRGIYIFLRRTALYPTFTMFDGPGRDVCSVKRARTNTPLQALATLNDPVFVEAAGGLARRVLTEAPKGLEERVRFAFRVCLARQPDQVEVDRLAALYRKALARYEKDPKAAAALVKHCRIEAKGLSVEELAAWTVLANVLLNLDETLTKP